MVELHWAPDSSCACADFGPPSLPLKIPFLVNAAVLTGDWFDARARSRSVQAFGAEAIIRQAGRGGGSVLVFACKPYRLPGRKAKCCRAESSTEEVPIVVLLAGMNPRDNTRVGGGDRGRSFPPVDFRNPVATSVLIGVGIVLLMAVLWCAHLGI